MTTMPLPVLLYSPGTHGNFLSRCLSVASGVNKDFDFYNNKKGAHSKTGIFNQVINHTHCTPTNNDDIFAYINIEPSDFYILNWHMLFAAADFGVDILTIENFDSLTHVINQQSEQSPWYPEYITSRINIFKDAGNAGMREMFKQFFSAEESLMATKSKIFAEYNIQNIFEFSWFYDQKIFCEKVKGLLVNLGYEYKVDILHHQQEFLDRKQNIIESKKLVELAFKCYTSNTSMDISNFCIYEQAYLDYLIEQHLGYEIENWQEYPTNTQDLNPIEAWEGVRYEF